MEGIELDSTHELLNRYKVKEGRNEDITIYSDEDSIFNSPSIELGRSAVKIQRIHRHLRNLERAEAPVYHPVKRYETITRIICTG